MSVHLTVNVRYPALERSRQGVLNFLQVFLLEDFRFAIALLFIFGSTSSVVRNRLRVRQRDSLHVAQQNQINRLNNGVQLNGVGLIRHRANIEALTSINRIADRAANVVLPIAQLAVELRPRLIAQRDAGVAPIEIEINDVERERALRQRREGVDLLVLNHCAALNKSVDAGITNEPVAGIVDIVGQFRVSPEIRVSVVQQPAGCCDVAL